VPDATELTSILYVEDEPDIRTVAKMALEMTGGFEVHLCSSGEEALESLAGFTPDLVLLDVMMPGMDGPTTLAELRKHPKGASVPVIFLTAKSQASEISAYRDAGAIGVIAKPFDPMTLASQVSELWSQHNG